MQAGARLAAIRIRYVFVQNEKSKASAVYEWKKMLFIEMRNMNLKVKSVKA